MVKYIITSFNNLIKYNSIENNLCFSLFFAVIHVSTVPFVGVHSLAGHLSQGYQAAEFASRSRYWCSKAMRFWFS